MQETSWEKLRNHKSRAWRWIVLLLLLIVAALLVFINNRDLFPGSSKSGNVSSGPVLFSLKNESDSPARNGGPSSIPADTAQRPSRESIHGANAVLAANKAAAFTEAALDSIEIDDVSGTALDRKDIRVHMGVTLFFTGKQHRRELLIKRDALTVMVKKAVHDYELEAIKIETLQPHLLKAMNTVFDSTYISDVVIRSLVIEKVPSE